MLNKKTGGQYVVINLAALKPLDYISVMEVHQNHIKKCIYYKQMKTYSQDILPQNQVCSQQRNNYLSIYGGDNEQLDPKYP